MFKRIYSSLMILLTFAGYSIYLPAGDAEQIKESIDTLLQHAENKNYEQASLLIAYDGDDKERKFTVNLNYDDEAERAQVKRVCKKIKALLDISDSYEYGTVTIEKNEGVEWHIMELQFKSGSQTLKTNFAFVKTGSRFLLADID